MLLKECYDTFGGSYESVRQRISKDEVIKKFVIKFLAESSYDKLRQAIENEDYVGAFNAAHALKGVSQNLSFERLGKSSSGSFTRHSQCIPASVNLFSFSADTLFSNDAATRFLCVRLGKTFFI